MQLRSIEKRHPAALRGARQPSHYDLIGSRLLDQVIRAMKSLCGAGVSARSGHMGQGQMVTVGLVAWQDTTGTFMGVHAAGLPGSRDYQANAYFLLRESGAGRPPRTRGTTMNATNQCVSPLTSSRPDLFPSCCAIPTLPYLLHQDRGRSMMAKRFTSPDWHPKRVHHAPDRTWRDSWVSASMKGTSARSQVFKV